MGKKLIFIGSSVCAGVGAENNRGWSALLADRLAAQGWQTGNCAIGGQTTADILLRLDRDVIQHRPDVCAVGLGLANEGLPRARDALSARVAQGIFESNLKKIVQALENAGIRPMLGGLYPNNEYRPFQYEILLETEAHMAAWGVPVFHWLSTLDDGRGHFRQGLYHDPWHPNERGYEAMYRQIPEF